MIACTHAAAAHAAPTALVCGCGLFSVGLQAGQGTRGVWRARSGALDTRQGMGDSFGSHRGAARARCCAVLRRHGAVTSMAMIRIPYLTTFAVASPDCIADSAVGMHMWDVFLGCLSHCRASHGVLACTPTVGDCMISAMTLCRATLPGHGDGRAAMTP